MNRSGDNIFARSLFTQDQDRDIGSGYPFHAFHHMPKARLGADNRLVTVVSPEPGQERLRVFVPEPAYVPEYII